MKRRIKAVPGKGIVANTVPSSQYVKAAWNGMFSPTFIMRNSNITDKAEAAKLSDYLWQHEYDSGFKYKEECLDFIEKWDGGFDGVYAKMLEDENQ